MSTENSKQILLDTFIASGKKFSIYEATKEDYKKSGIVDGVNILGRVVGPFFAVNGASRNGRFYSRELWEKAIRNTSDRVASGMMLGTVGHEVKLDDEGLMKGHASHKVTKLQIEGNEGTGELLILATSAGKELNALLRGGVKLAVSSRAEGSFNGKTADGLDIVDPDTYQLTGFDFVQEPGIASAYPTLVESQSTSAGVDGRNEGVKMTQEVNEQFQALLENTTKAKVKLEGDVVALTESITEAQGQIARLQEALTAAETKSATLEKDLGESKAKTVSMVGKLSESNKAYTQYKALGSVSQLREALSRADSTINAYSKLGTPKKIEEALTRARATLDQYASNGTVAEVAAATDLLETYVKLGSIKQLQERLSNYYRFTKIVGTPAFASSVVESLSQYKKIGTLKEMNVACESLESYLKIGTLDEVNALVAATQKTIDTSESRKQSVVVDKMAAKYSADRKTVAELVESVGAASAESMLKRLSGVTETTARYQVAPKQSGIGRITEQKSNVKGTTTAKVNESAHQSVVTGTRVAGLMKAFAK